MNRLTINTLLFIAIIGLCLSASIQLTISCNQLQNQLNTCCMLATDQSDQLQKQNNALLALWNKHRQRIELFSNREETQELDYIIQRMQALAEKGDYTLYLAECESAKAGLRQLLKGNSLEYDLLI